MRLSASDTRAVCDHLGKPPGLGRQMAIISVVLAIAIQAFVVQIHVHFISQYGWTPPVHGAVEPVRAILAGDQIGLTQQEAFDACPVCQAQATGGRTALLLEPPLPRLSERIPALIVAQAFVREFNAVSHIWQSRAPPAL